MTVNIIQPSFSSGELSPGLYARVDLDKYHAGAALLRNFFVDYRGGARNRAGTRWIGKVLGGTGNVRFVKFAFNTDQTYVLEFGNGYMRVLKNGGYVLEPGKAITAISQANPGVITSAAHGFSNGDWVFLQSIVGMIELNARTFQVANVTANTFTLIDVFTGVAVNTIPFTAYSSGGFASRVFTLTTPYLSADIFTLRFTQSADVITITHNNYFQQNLTRTAHYIWTLAVAAIGTSQAAPTALTIAGFGSAAGTTAYRYGVTAVSATNGDESLIAEIDISLADVFDDKTMAIKVGWTAPAGAAFYNVYRAPYGKGDNAIANGTILGLIGTTRALFFTDKGFTADFSITPPVNATPLGANHPLVSTYFQQRKIYAGGDNFPETFWTTRINSFNNMNVSLPLKSDDAITATLSSLQVNAIKHMIPMPGGLITFTTGGVWQISGGGVNTPITPANIVAVPQGYNGAGDLPPIPNNFNILYVQKGGAVVRDLSYNFFVNIYSSVDITTLSSHLLQGHQIVDWTFSEEPWKVFWLVREDGKLLSLTYQQENEVVAWAQHDTLGLVRSVCAISEGGEDYVYMVVERYNAAIHAWQRHAERMESRVLSNGLDSAWFLDCAQEYPLIYLSAILVLGAATGTNIAFSASAPVFTAGMVGRHIRFRGGLALITVYNSTTQVHVDILQPFPALDDGTPLYAPSGEWSCTPRISVLGNLYHLEGKQVMILADGGVIGPVTVTNAQVPLGNKLVSRVICGLPYKAQLTTLYLDVGDPNAQGREKSIPAVTVRVEDTRGLAAGPGFNDLTEMKLDPNSLYTVPAPLITDDVRFVVGSYFNNKGQLFFEQSYPLPATILGVIPEVWIGDT